MDLSKVNPISYYKYLLIGDSFLDFYFDSKIKVFYGGVLNVQKNIETISSNKFELKTSQKPKCLNFFKKNKKIFSKINSKEIINKETIFTKVTTISDYNKGFLHNNVKVHARILIVDSKYCSLLRDYIVHAKIKILKLASTDVFNTEFIELFDYLIVTYSTHVNLFHKGNLIYSCKVKNNLPICTIGAGDVFVASLTSYLYNCFKQFQLSDLISAIDFATYYASESVAASFTCRIKEI